MRTIPVSILYLPLFSDKRNGAVVAWGVRISGTCDMRKF
jgi:hypothetical protein